MKHAVESIPAYIERVSLLLVLAPVCMHQDRQEACNFATWRRRGWCRLELQASLLKCGTLHVMVCTGPEATPYFLYPVDAYQLLCESGSFSCCQRDHFINGCDIECDKAKVRVVLEAMIDNKVRYLEKSGHQDRMCWVESLRDYMLSGLPRDGWAHQVSQSEYQQHRSGHLLSARPNLMTIDQGRKIQ